LNGRGKARYNARLSSFPSISVAEVCHEGAVLPEVGEGPSPRLQGGPPSWQGFRDLQVESAFQGAPALKKQRAQGAPALKKQRAQGAPALKNSVLKPRQR
jgi:hypothetical protein